jgi:TPP-dependent pyruvate/acetoin dehydrogenase alpha subunit
MLLVRTQLSQAVGVAYSLKMDKKDACVVTYTGDGGTSEVTVQKTLKRFSFFLSDLFLFLLSNI